MSAVITTAVRISPPPISMTGWMVSPSRSAARMTVITGSNVESSEASDAPMIFNPPRNVDTGIMMDTTVIAASANQPLLFCS